MIASTSNSSGYKSVGTRLNFLNEFYLFILLILWIYFIFNKESILGFFYIYIAILLQFKNVKIHFYVIILLRGCHYKKMKMMSFLLGFYYLLIFIKIQNRKNALWCTSLNILYFQNARSKFVILCPWMRFLQFLEIFKS